MPPETQKLSGQSSSVKALFLRKNGGRTSRRELGCGRNGTSRSNHERPWNPYYTFCWTHSGTRKHCLCRLGGDVLADGGVIPVGHFEDLGTIVTAFTLLLIAVAESS